MNIWLFPVSILITTSQWSHFLPLSAMFCPFLSQMITFYHIFQLSLSSLCLMTKLFASKGPGRYIGQSLSIFISPPLHFLHIMNSSACLFKSGTVCWLSGWMAGRTWGNCPTLRQWVENCSFTTKGYCWPLVKAKQCLGTLFYFCLCYL